MVSSKNNRVLIVDALRGFALFMIVAIHFVEHFHLFSSPEINFLFTPEQDRWVRDTVFKLVSGKAYSVFALLFGLSFFIQMDRKQRKGVDFRGRFFWRLILLFVMGVMHSLLYSGDILHVYAVLGILLLLVFKWQFRTLVVLAVLLLLQLPLLAEFFASFRDSGYNKLTYFSMYWDEANQIRTSGSFWELIQFNALKGRQMAWSWSWNNGRLLQLTALFVLGLLLGRIHFFERLDSYKKRLLPWAGICILLFGFVMWLRTLVTSGAWNAAQKEVANVWLQSFSNLAVTGLIVIALAWIYTKKWLGWWFRQLACCGRMSLTNYVCQPVVGVLLFYGFGLALHRFIGTSWSLLIGVVFFAMQVAVSSWWFEKFRYGPLEWLWRALTFMNFSLPMRKKADLAKRVPAEG